VNGLSIRTAEPDDVPAVQDVYRRASLSNDGDRAALLANPDSLEFSDVSVHDQQTRVAVREEQIVGFATGRQVGDIVELDDLFVAPEFMREGIGLALVNDAITVAAANGAARIEVTANGHALEFYQAAGFVLDGVTQTQFGAGHRMHLDVVLTD
jgi:ribosomal protein S18 acetylase RimI-like enzyme